MMKKITFLVVSFAITLLSYGQDVKKEHKHFGKTISVENFTPSGHIRCISTEYEEYLQKNDPNRMTNEQFENWISNLIEKNKNNNETSSESGGIIYIPVVVHVIHNGDDYGVNENITDEQVESQIIVMTQDFRRMAGTPGFNSNPVGADTNIEFVLAKVDPNGNPTNGINRVNMCEASWSTTDINSIVKPATIWDPTQYMNMWSVNFTDGSLLGYAQFPDGSGLAGLNPVGGSASTDGVVAGYRFFGSSDLATGNFAAPFDLGRTMTHEVGHYLGLRHIWGDGNCGADDFCADTPNAGAPNGGCPAGTDSCGGGGPDMIENYMDYTDDACMNIFTQDQTTRMITVMNNSPRRASLKTSTKDLPIPLFANDAEVIIENYCTASGNPCSGNTHKVLLYNRGNTNLTAASLSYNVNGGASSTYNWTGDLAPNKYEIISLTTMETNGTFNVSVTGANGVADQRSSNNSDSKSFSFPPVTPPTEYAYTNFRMTLIQDDYGVETTWDLKDSSGTIIYSGGPYTTNGSGGGSIVYDTDWNLPPDCYTFSIYDSYGDGICCAYGAGSYTITTNSGAITVGNGGSFGAFESVSFSNASLSSNNFALESISVYPNPTKDVLNISIPSELGSNISYDIYNYLGQIVTRSSSSNSNFSVNTSSYSTGVYFIKLQTEAGTKTVRFIKE